MVIMDMKKLYAQHLQDHYQNPRNIKKLQNPTFCSCQKNHSCGDKVSIEGIITNDIVADLFFQGEGCVISLATASILTEFCKGKNISEILNLESRDILKLIGIELGISRLRCAVLPLIALQDGIKSYIKTKGENA